jgi:dTDP-4-amino-4,6-dideoxygalactose transaminase
MTTPQDLRPTVSIADPDVGEREMNSVRDVLASGQLSAGDTVRSFETEFADFCDVEHGVATSNGTTALHTALEALDVGEGDTVLTTPLSFIATANAVRLVGAEPVFADVNPSTYNLDPSAAEAKLRSLDGDVDAIIAVHLYGLPAAIDHLQDVADRYDVPLIEDAAQAHGAEFDGEPVGSLGDVACFSFYPTKNMTTGEGGMITTDRDDVAERASAFINHGRSAHDCHERVGHNFRMTDLAAAIGRVQLQKLPGYVKARRENAARFANALRDSPIRAPREPDDRRHAYHQYTIQGEDRADLRDHLSSYGVDSSVYYPTPIHEQPAYADVEHSAPNAEQATEEILSIPVHPNLTDRDRRAIATALADYSHS